MPAQILPLIDTTNDSMQVERLAQQQQYHDQLNSLREAKMANEEALSPLRQQIMQSELARNDQSMKESAQRMMQGGIAAEQDYKSKVLDQQLTGLNIKHTQQTMDEQAQNFADEKKNDWKGKLAQSDLDDRAGSAAEHLGTFLASVPILYRNPVERANALQPLLKNGTIDQPTFNKILSVPFTSKQQSELATQLDTALGDGSGAQFEALTKEAEVLKLPLQAFSQLPDDQVKSAQEALKESFSMLEKMRTIRKTQQQQADNLKALDTKKKTGGAPLPPGVTLNDNGTMNFGGETYRSDPSTKKWVRIDGGK